jgi:phosphoribosyl 1,2-cyclic phosphate phosphodiesterase
MSKIIIMGSGAAPGVPCLSRGFGACNPDNEKNYRMRSGTYMELSGVKFLIDTSPDLRMQLLYSDITELDAVFYTHVHADHLHGIDDLREVNRVMQKPIELYASEFNLSVIRQRFGYLLTDNEPEINPIYRAALNPNVFTYNQSFFLQKLKVTPIALKGHNLEVSGYIFNDGEVVHLSDFKEIDEEALKLIKQTPEILIVPLTTPEGTRFHAGFDDLCRYADLLKPKKMIITHMASECDYDGVCQMCQKNSAHIEPAYDGMVIEF